MKVRLLRQPHGFVDGISLRRYHPGQAYEMPPSLADYLVAQGFGFFEMRSQRRSMRERPDRRRRP